MLLFVGRLMPEKGILDLLDAFRAVVERTGCRLMVCGSGPLEGEVRRRVAQHGLDSHVTIRGYLTGEDLVAAYRDADVFVLPTYWGEGFPTVIGEAMGAGLPIVTTRIRGVADLLEEGTNALFVPPRDPDALACALLRLTEHPSLRDRMSTANREKIKAFAPDIVARQYLQAFACIAGRSAVRHARRPPVLARPLPGKPARPSSGATGPAVHNLMDELSGGRT